MAAVRQFEYREVSLLPYLPAYLLTVPRREGGTATPHEGCVQDREDWQSTSPRTQAVYEHPWEKTSIKHLLCAAHRQEGYR